MESVSVGKMKKQGKNKNRSQNNSHKKDMVEDLDYYEYEKMTQQDYKNMQYLSHREKQKFEDKFSKPRNESQKKLYNSLKNKDYKVIIASGPEGTGKTLFGVEQGIKNFMNGNYEKLIFTRPVVSTDEDIGYLPGTLEEKCGPYLNAIFDILHTFITPKEVEKMVEEKIIEIAPLGFMRGRTFKNCWIVADEMQNSTISQMKMLLTRIGENTRLVITGDCEQHDRKFEKNGLEDFLNKIKGRRSDSISSVEFNKTDVEREDVVREVLEIYETNKLDYGNEDISTESSKS